MKVGSLFSGIGGLDLGLERAGMEIAWQVEIDEFCLKVLKKHWPEVPKYGDIRKIDPKELEPVDLIAGGFPCQPFSVAGKRRGKEDDRYLWPEMFRIIKALRPTWVLGENVPGIVKQALDTVCSDLESIEYTVWPISISSYCVGAMFKGERIFILAQANNGSGSVRRNGPFPTVEKTEGCWSYYRRRKAKSVPGQWRELKSRPFGVAYGVPNRVDRIRALGNAVVPQVAEVIGRAIIAYNKETVKKGLDER